MHAVFWMHGKKEQVDRLIKWLETRIVLLPFKNPDLNPNGFKDKDGNVMKEGLMPIEGVLRYGLFGTWEYIFPEEYKDQILSILKFNTSSYGYLGWKFKARVEAMRIALGCKKIPDFKVDNVLYIPDDVRAFVSIIPIGVRYDKKIDTGAIHEGL